MLFSSGSLLSRVAQDIVSKLLPSTGNTTLQCHTLDEVSFHDNYQDCWIVLFDKVYDITEFVQLNLKNTNKGQNICQPVRGGETILLEHAGRDATFTFISTGHGEQMLSHLSQYLVGVLSPEQQMWQQPVKEEVVPQQVLKNQE